MWPRISRQGAAGLGDRPGTEDSSHALGSGPEIVFATAPGPAANRPRGSTAARAVCHPRRSFHRQHGFPVRRPRGDLRARRRARTAGCVKQPRVRLLPPTDSTAASLAASPAERSPIAVLKSNQNPSWLRGRLTRHALSIASRHQDLRALTRHLVDVRQETELRVRHGSISSLTVRVPMPRSQAWQVQAKETVKRESWNRRPTVPAAFGSP